jgi:hypothetical protein
MPTAEIKESETLPEEKITYPLEFIIEGTNYIMEAICNTFHSCRDDEDVLCLHQRIASTTKEIIEALMRYNRTIQKDNTKLNKIHDVLSSIIEIISRNLITEEEKKICPVCGLNRKLMNSSELKLTYINIYSDGSIYDGYIKDTEIRYHSICLDDSCVTRNKFIFLKDISRFVKLPTHNRMMPILGIRRENCHVGYITPVFMSKTLRNVLNLKQVSDIQRWNIVLQICDVFEIMHDNNVVYSNFDATKIVYTKLLSNGEVDLDSWMLSLPKFTYSSSESFYDPVAYISTDIYNLGIFLLEMFIPISPISGRIFSDRAKKTEFSESWFQGEVKNIPYPKLRKLVSDCLKVDGKTRPSMKQIKSILTELHTHVLALYNE